MKWHWIIIAIILTFATGVVEAQCPMCRISAESNLNAGGSAGSGLNTGILYMLTMPYLIVGFLLYMWYKREKTVTE